MSDTILFFIFNVMTVWLYPSLTILLLLVLSILLWSKRLGRWFLFIAVIYFYLISCGVIPNLLMKPLQSGFRPVTDKVILEHRGLILLGGGDTRAPWGGVPNILSYPRLMEAYRIYHFAQQHAVHYTLYISGGDTNKRVPPEALVYKQVLMGLGVAAHDIVLESHSLNTYQNAQFMAKLVAHNAAQTYLLLTSGYHMKRALLYFRHFHLSVLPAVSDYTNASSYITGMPSAYNIVVMQLAVHEYLGSWRFKLARLI